MDIEPRPDIPELPIPALPPLLLSPEERSWLAEGLRSIGWKVSPVRATLETLLRENRNPTPEEVTRLANSFTKLLAKRWRGHLLAAWSLSHFAMYPPEQKRATEALSGALRTGKWEDFGEIMVKVWGVVTVATTVLTLVLTKSASEPAAWLAAGIGLGILSLPFICVGTSLWADMRLNHLRTAMLESLGALGIPESAGAVARTYRDLHYGRSSSFDRRVKAATREALPKVLKHLTPAHYLALDPDLVPNLCVAVQKETDEALLLVVLEALGKVGDGRAVLPVERLEKKGRTAQIRQAAAAILPILRDRQNKENAHSTLLRASATPNDAPNVLLRPAHFVQDNSPMELLRPINNSSPQSLDLSSYTPASEATQSVTSGTVDTTAAFDVGSALAGGFTSAADFGGGDFGGGGGDGGGGGGD